MKILSLLLLKVYKCFIIYTNICKKCLISDIKKCKYDPKSIVYMNMKYNRLYTEYSLIIAYYKAFYKFYKNEKFKNLSLKMLSVSNYPLTESMYKRIMKLHKENVGLIQLNERMLKALYMSKSFIIDVRENERIIRKNEKRIKLILKIIDRKFELINVVNNELHISYLNH